MVVTHAFGLLNGSFRPKDEVCVLRTFLRLPDTLAKDDWAHQQPLMPVLTSSHDCSTARLSLAQPSGNKVTLPGYQQFHKEVEKSARYLEVGGNPVAIQFGEAETSPCTNYSNLIRHVLHHASMFPHTTVPRMRSPREVPPGSATIW
jgi:hypothetical protein